MSDPIQRDNRTYVPSSNVYHESNRLSSLSEAQTAYLEEAKRFWIDRVTKPIQPDKTRVNELTTAYFNKFLPKKDPFLLWVDSPIEEQDMANLLINAKVDRSDEEQIAHAKAVFATLKGLDRTEREKVLKEHCKEISFFRTNPYINIRDCGWVGYYAYLREIGCKIGENEEHLWFFDQMLRAGLFSSIYIEGKTRGVAILVCGPVSISLNEQMRPHKTDGPAIRFADGFGLYFLNGVSFEDTLSPDLYIRCTEGKIPFDELLRMSNIEQRVQAMRFADPLKFFEHANARTLDSFEKTAMIPEVIHSSLATVPKKVTYHLVKVPAGELFSEDVCFMTYNCPSTDRQYMTEVPSRFSKVQDAMGWKFSVRPEVWESWEPMVSES